MASCTGFVRWLACFYAFVLSKLSISWNASLFCLLVIAEWNFLHRAGRTFGTVRKRVSGALRVPNFALLLTKLKTADVRENRSTKTCKCCTASENI